MFKQISVNEAKELFKSDNTVILDIRDVNSFSQGHIPNAKNISVNELNHFCEKADKNNPIVVCCYHGISSQSVAQYLAAQGFSTVYSLIGGFEAWRSVG